MKKSYQAPRLTVHGTVLQITQATTSGTRLDKSYQVGEEVGTVAGQLPNNLS